MLPRRLPKADKRPGRWKSPAHCNFVRDHHCCVPGCDNRPIEVAHVRRGSDAGMGRKPSDWHTISLCRDHHHEQHTIGESSFEGEHGINMAALADAFAKSSPKKADIVKAKRERGL